VQVVNTGGLLPGDPPTYASALCWGDNLAAALGTTFLPYSSVYNVAYTSPGATYMQVSAGMHFTCAVAYPSGASSGPITCWGNNGFGQLGIGTNSPHEAPGPLNAISNAVEVTTGEQHACARLATAQVQCWGTNSSGALGDGTNTDHTSPAAVVGVTDAVQLASNQLMTCARRSTGRVSCWGTGPLGNGMTSSNVPVAVTSIDNAIDVSIGVDHGCVVRSDHTVWCWGGNANGQLGTGATMSTATPVRAVVVTP
jgi:alpha-tubulin suppressor-like RCC1 family protein